MFSMQIFFHRILFNVGISKRHGSADELENSSGNVKINMVTSVVHAEQHRQAMPSLQIESIMH